MKLEKRNRAQSSKTVLNDETWKKQMEPRVIKLFLMMKPENRNRAQSSRTVLNDETWKKK